MAMLIKSVAQMVLENKGKATRLRKADELTFKKSLASSANKLNRGIHDSKTKTKTKTKFNKDTITEKLQTFELSFKNDADARIGFYHMDDGGWRGLGRIYQLEIPSNRERVVVVYKLIQQDVMLFQRHLKELVTVSWELR